MGNKAALPWLVLTGSSFNLILLPPWFVFWLVLDPNMVSHIKCIFSPPPISEVVMFQQSKCRLRKQTFVSLASVFTQEHLILPLPKQTNICSRRWRQPKVPAETFRRLAGFPPWSRACWCPRMPASPVASLWDLPQHTEPTKKQMQS